MIWTLHHRDKPDGAPAGYLMGTMHLRDERVFRWFEPAVGLMSGCDVFAGEYDFEETRSEDMDGLFKNPPGPTLHSLMSPGLWKALQWHNRKKWNLPHAVLERLHPFTLSMMLSDNSPDQERPETLDEALWQMARQLGMRTAGLETFDFQWQVLQNIPFERHLESLRHQLRHQGRMQRASKNLMEWYVRGDAGALYQRSRRDTGDMRRAFIFDRNRHMANRLSELLLHHRVFAAVGAGHLAGGKGMLRFLKKEGWIARRWKG